MWNYKDSVFKDKFRDQSYHSVYVFLLNYYSQKKMKLFIGKIK